MTVLIVEANPELGKLWADHFGRRGMQARLVVGEEAAISALRTETAEVIVVDLDLPGSGAIAVADYAAYRRPEARIVFVTASSFFSDGSIFSMSPNAAAFLPARTPPEDLAAVVEFHANRAGLEP